MKITKRPILVTAGLLALILAISIWWLVTPKPPTTREINALYGEPNGVITNRFQCTVSSEEKSSGITQVWAIAYYPEPGGDSMNAFAIVKIHGEWQILPYYTDHDNTLTRCLKERSSSGKGSPDSFAIWP